MLHFFSPKNNRVIAGVIAAVLVVSMVVSGILSILL
jgi:hypothetical protein